MHDVSHQPEKHSTVTALNRWKTYNRKCEIFQVSRYII